MILYLILREDNQLQNIWETDPDWERGYEKAGVRFPVCITDDPKVSGSLMKKGICAIGVEYTDRPECIRHPDAFAVLLDPEEIRGAWIRLQCSHYYGVPFTVYEDDCLRIRESIPEDYDCLKGILEEGFDFCRGDTQRRSLFEAYTRHAYQTWGFGMWTVLVKAGEMSEERESPQDRDEWTTNGPRDRDEWTTAGPQDGDEWTTAGWCGLYPAPADGGKNRNEDGNGLEMGYAVLPRLRRRGIAFRAGTAILRYAAEELNADELCVRIRKDNKASLHLAERLGFKANAVPPEKSSRPGKEEKILLCVDLKNAADDLS